MIKTFAHKEIKRFYTNGKSSGLHQEHLKRLRLILARLDAIKKPEDMNLPGFDFHPLTGKFKEYYAVSVNKNWRIIFKFDGMDVTDVDYLDYH